MSVTHTRDIPRETNEIFLENKNIVVEKVHVTGIKKTKADYIVDDVTSVFDCDTFLEAYKSAQECRNKLLSKGLFQSVEVYLDTTEAYGENLNNGVQVMFKVKERGLLCGEVKTEMSNHEKPRWVMRILSPNVFGRGETLSGSLSHSLSNNRPFSGLYRPSDFSATFSKPYLSGAKFQLSLLQEKQDAFWSSSTQVSRGLHANYGFQVLGNQHNLEWLCQWRELLADTNASFEVRKQMGHSLKSSLSHSLVVDKTDCAVLPRSGLYFKLFEELAGFGGDVRFAKEVIESSIHTTFLQKLTFGLGFQGGIMLPLPHKRDSNICDKFFIGGPLSLRGFETNSAGKADSGSFLGSTGFWVVGGHVYTPLPFFWSKFGQGSWVDNIRLHAFVTAGNSFDFKLANSLSGNLLAARHNTRLSYGAGIVWKFMNAARFELNFCIPLRAQSGDRLCNGFQFGIGVSSV